jgi:thymidylate synthase (FAD)
MTAHVEVIGYTKFIDVPKGLHPADGYAGIDKALQDIGSDAARLIECAGRTCYDSYGKGRPSKDYPEHIKMVGHGSVVEHFTINFFLSNLSRGLTHELVRHRIGTAISQRSTRYVQESESPYIHHPLVVQFMEECNLHVPEVADVMNTYITSAQGQARDAYNHVAEQLEAWLVNKGIPKVDARKQARGAARGYLGNALFTEMVWSANIRALRNFIELRANKAADAEIRVLANRIYEFCLSIAPEYFDDYTKVECQDGIGYGLETKYRKI